MSEMTNSTSDFFYKQYLKIWILLLFLIISTNKWKIQDYVNVPPPPPYPGTSGSIYPGTSLTGSSYSGTSIAGSTYSGASQGGPSYAGGPVPGQFHGTIMSPVSGHSRQLFIISN